jgi:hypothetical protein
VLLLTGCPAEQLGVPLPPRGLAAINQEDIQRDLFRLLDPGGTQRHADAATWVQQRLAQMGLEHVESADGTTVVCALRGGDEPDAVLLMSRPGSSGAAQAALPDAALISLAKSADGLGRPRRSLLFCSVPLDSTQAFSKAPPLPWDRIRAVTAIGRLDGSELAQRQLDLHGHPVLEVTAELPQGQGAEDGMERLDYQRIAAHLRSLHTQLLVPELTPRD